MFFTRMNRINQSSTPNRNMFFLEKVLLSRHNWRRRRRRSSLYGK
jgi:hypothetical protein